MRHAFPATAILIAALASPLMVSQSSGADAEPPGLGDPGQLQSVTVETGRVQDGGFVISGRDASQQLIVSGKYSTGQLRDLSRSATYTVSPADVVNVDSTGHVTPIQEGTASIHVKAAEGIDATVNVTVTDIKIDKPVNFPNQVTPIFTKYGCNGGGCHGKSGGQNGFALSLLGFEPPEDYEYLVKEGRGRRLFPSAPRSEFAAVESHGQVASRRWSSHRRRLARVPLAAPLDRTRHALRQSR